MSNYIQSRSAPPWRLIVVCCSAFPLVVFSILHSSRRTSTRLISLLCFPNLGGLKFIFSNFKVQVQRVSILDKFMILGRKNITKSRWIKTSPAGVWKWETKKEGQTRWRENMHKTNNDAPFGKMKLNHIAGGCHSRTLPPASREANWFPSFQIFNLTSKTFWTWPL